MNTKRMGKWVIVLFLLAALPGMTAVVAQGQEPPEKEMAPAAVTDVGETLNVNYTYWEWEPNNTQAQAIAVDYIDAEVWGGNVANGDVDWYKFYVNAVNTSILVNTDARINDASTDTDTIVTLYDSAGNWLNSNDDMGDGSYDSLLFYVNQAVGWYYVKVSDYEGYCETNCSYELMIGRSLLVSAAAAGLGTGNVEGIPFRSEDILSLMLLKNDHNGNPQHKWVLLMDGSDIGITKAVVNIGLGWAGGASLSMTFGANQVLQIYNGSYRTFKPWDWAEMYLDRVGPNTLMGFTDAGYPGIEYHAGADHGLTTATEKPDALDLNAAYAPTPGWTANLFFSTTGAASVPKAGGGILKTADEDVFQSTTWQGNTTGWQNSLLFDGSTVAGLAAEDIFAADYEASTGRIALVIQGTGKVLAHNVTQKDVFVLQKSGSAWVWHSMIHLPDYGWNYNLDAIDSGGN